jgi:ABC-type lipoprotein release transport system permease subunit
MRFYRLILREILHRKLNFCLGALSASVAVGCVVAESSILRRHDARTRQILAAKEAETQARVAALEDDYRKLMLKMGFNVLILPKDQNLADLYAEDFASHYMPEDYAARLARSRVATINHVLPSLQAKLEWPEYGRTVLLMGVRSEVYVQSAQQKPLLAPVAPGTVVVGHELAGSLHLNSGDKTRLKGREFTVARVNPARGNKDDITLWINLSEAQEMLDKPGLINGILALDCTCDTANRLGRIRPEIAQILPDTQVIEFASQALARAEARQRAAEEARNALAREKENRARLRRAQESMAAILAPLMVLGAGLWIGILSFANVHARRAEIGILRALGVRSRQLRRIFLGRAALMGLAGACAGYAGGLLVAGLWRDTPGTPPIPLLYADPALAAVALLGAPLLAVLAGWLPAVVAARQDPAAALREQ